MPDLRRDFEDLLNLAIAARAKVAAIRSAYEAADPDARVASAAVVAREIAYGEDLAKRALLHALHIAQYDPDLAERVIAAGKRTIAGMTPKPNDTKH